MIIRVLIFAAITKLCISDMPLYPDPYANAISDYRSQQQSVQDDHQEDPPIETNNTSTNHAKILVANYVPHTEVNQFAPVNINTVTRTVAPIKKDPEIEKKTHLEPKLPKIENQHRVPIVQVPFLRVPQMQLMKNGLSSGYNIIFNKRAEERPPEIEKPRNYKVLGTNVDYNFNPYNDIRNPDPYRESYRNYQDEIRKNNIIQEHSLIQSNIMNRNLHTNFVPLQPERAYPFAYTQRPVRLTTAYTTIGYIPITVKPFKISHMESNYLLDPKTFDRKQVISVMKPVTEATIKPLSFFGKDHRIHLNIARSYNFHVPVLSKNWVHHIPNKSGFYKALRRKPKIRQSFMSMDSNDLDVEQTGIME